MPEKLPKSPFRLPEDAEKQLLTDEIEAWAGFIGSFTGRQRAKNPDNPLDVDKSIDDTNESVGDHAAMTAYLMHYFLPLLEQGGTKLDYEKTLDMVLARNVSDMTNFPPTPGVQKTPDERRLEIAETAKIFGELPQRNGFNRQLFDAYAEYLDQAKSEARFTRGVSGLATMLYVLSKPEDKRADLVGGKGYALEDYRERIGRFCNEEFPPLKEFYLVLERFFHKKEYFAPSRTYTNEIIRPDLMRSIFESNAPEFSFNSDINADNENARLLRLYKLKRKTLFGQEPKSSSDYHDTDAEHTASALFLARYFIPAIKADPTQERRDVISLRNVIEVLLAHDIPETLTGDMAIYNKTHLDSANEREAADKITFDYAPRAGKFNRLFIERFKAYELGKMLPLAASDETAAKALDVMEGQLNILSLEQEGGGTPPGFRYQSYEQVEQKAGKFIRLFPVISTHFDVMNKAFIKKGLFKLH